MNKTEKEVISHIFQEAESDENLKQVTEESLTTLINFTGEWKVHRHLLEKKTRCFNNKMSASVKIKLEKNIQ